MPHFVYDGAEIYYETHGSGSAVALTYCLGGNCQMWLGQIEALAAVHKVILWDPRGHGRSSCPTAPEAYSITRSARDLAGLLEHLGQQDAVVGGLSMGGGISARYAMLYPSRPRGLIIVDSNTAAGLPVPEPVREIREKTIALCEAGDMEAVADYFLPNSPPYTLYAGDTPENRARVREMITANDPAGFAHTLRAMLCNEFATEDLRAIVAPTLIVAGAKDPAMPGMELTRDNIPDARMVTIPGAGHLANLDAPGAVERAILDFIARLQ